MPQIPSLEELLQAGVHFGHATDKWSPKMASYLFTQRGGVHIIDLEKTREHLEKACQYVKELAAQGKTVLFVGTKPQARDIIRKHAEDAKTPYVVERWIGGTLTNLPVILGMAKKLKMIHEAEESGELKRKYTKKERLMFARDKERLERDIGGIKDVTALPDALFVVGAKEEDTAIREAHRKKIPVVGIADSNVDPDRLTMIIPANDDAVKSIDLIVGLMAAAVKEGAAEREAGKQAAEQAKSVEVKVEEQASELAE